jgi:hypothetical protein
MGTEGRATVLCERHHLSSVFCSLTPARIRHSPDSTLVAGLRLLLWVRRSVSAFVRALRLDVLEHGPVDNTV